MLAAWLRRILARTLADAAKHHGRDRRDVDRERSLEADLDRSASGLASWLAADQTSPSGRAGRNEEVLQLVEALTDLPEPMREVVILKHCQGWTLRAFDNRFLPRPAPVAAQSTLLSTTPGDKRRKRNAGKFDAPAGLPAV